MSIPGLNRAWPKTVYSVKKINDCIKRRSMTVYTDDWWLYIQKINNYVETIIVCIYRWLEAGFMIYTAASQQGAIQMIWLYFLRICQVVHLYFAVIGPDWHVFPLSVTVAVLTLCGDLPWLQTVNSARLTPAFARTRCHQHFLYKPVHSYALWWMNIETYWRGYKQYPPLSWCWTIQSKHISQKHTAIEHQRRHKHQQHTDGVTKRHRSFTQRSVEKHKQADKKH